MLGDLPLPSLAMTIQDLVKGYISAGIPMDRAVKYIVGDRMDAACARGHGNRAAKREAMAETFAAAEHIERPTELDVDNLARRYGY